MCHDASAEPPIYSEPVTTADGGSLILNGTDGAAFAAYRAMPATVTGRAVLILPDNRGLSGFYETLAIRLAEQGHPALAVDYFGRTAGLDHRARTGFDDMATVMPHLMALTRPGLYGDIDAGIAYLRALDLPVAALGFCFGGRLAFLTADPAYGLSHVVGLYGALDEINGSPGPNQVAATLTTPILGLFGGADPGIPAEAVDRFDRALTAARTPHDLVVYPDAPHSFFDRHYEEHRQASADAWRRILSFLS
ncbi:MAG: dienelactone hydrolase family protein [Hamadaea sp.]|uniref:dienelactone hydrolase family protein n=1 Tax=Hamadaea sp. TaxID=2024425 RepID=UPI0017FBF033|nr:dienelactone hydrolase family protein [Hamadaea sp.]NUR72840.1 dienelactone hydrolase family protein [Hamadaea sp.]NUT20607.1 dienelactone hydrolase family protein [Hamadaea sp.]